MPAALLAFVGASYPRLKPPQKQMFWPLVAEGRESSCKTSSLASRIRSGEEHLLYQNGIAEGVNDVETPSWFCLRAQPKREHIAAEGLRRQFQVQCFAPRVRFRKATQRGAGWFVEAMFPGYLFAEFAYAEFHRRVCSAPGVVSLVRFGESIPIIEPEAIALMRQASSDNEVITIAPELRPGDPVLVVEGPFRGLTALVTQVLPAKERIRILLEFLGREIETEMPLIRVLPSENARSLPSAPNAP